jgi:uncharacterized membrane protein
MQHPAHVPWVGCISLQGMTRLRFDMPDRSCIFTGLALPVQDDSSTAFSKRGCMYFKSKRTVITEALEDWRSRGLLDPVTAQRLQDDLEQGKVHYSFNAFIITAGIICLCFAAMTFVAANWEEMDRLLRLALVMVALWAAWGAALWAGLRALHWWHEGLMLLGCGMFGAGIMLVSQIYHIQGNAADAVWLWGLGSLLAAVLARGTMTLALTIGLFALWHVMQIDIAARAHDLNLVYLVWWLAGAGLAWWQRNRLAGHLSVLALCLWLLSALATVQSPHAAALMLLAATVSVMSGLLASFSGRRFLHGFEAPILAYAALVLGACAFYLTLSHGAHDWPMPGDDMAHGTLWSVLALLAAPSVVLALLARVRAWTLAYDLAACAGLGIILLLAHVMPRIPLLSEALLLAPFIWITRMGWRLDQRSLRAIGMAGFILALLVVYDKTVGSLIGTSGFYLGAGLILLSGAWVATRLGLKGKGGS